MIAKDITTAIEKELMAKGKVKFMNFGTIKLRERKAITRVLNGKVLHIPPRRIAEFIPSKTFLKRLWQK